MIATTTFVALLAASDGFGFMLFLLVVGGVVTAVVLGIRHNKKVTETWANFARRNNMQFNGNRAAGMSGYFAGVHLRIQTITRGSGKNRSTYTQYFAYLSAPAPAGLTLYREGFFSSMGKMFGGADIQIGDPELDKALIIRGTDVLGVHNLLRNPHVKKALLYAIQRHPGLRIEERQILVEESGTTARPERMEALAQDLSYLAGTFNAALQQNAPGAAAPVQVAAPPRSRGKSQPTLTSVPRPAATADILQASAPNLPSARPDWHVSAQSNVFDQSAAPSSAKAEWQGAAVNNVFDQSAAPSTARADWQGPSLTNAFDQATSPPPVVRRANAAEEAAKRRAMAEMLGGFKALEGQLKSGERVPETPVRDFQARNDEFAARSGREDAFAAPRNDDAFANPTLNADVKPGFGSSAFDARPQDAFAARSADVFAAKSNNSFGSAPATPASKGGEARTLDELIARLSDRALMSKDREDLIKAHFQRVWMLEVVIDRIDRSFGFDLPENMRDGRTIEASVPGKDMKLVVRYPASRNGEMDKHRSGEKLSIEGSLHGWDDLFKKATLDAF